MTTRHGSGGCGFYYYNSSQFPFISGATQSIHNMCTLKAKVVVLKRQLLELLRALRRIPLPASSPELVELSGPSSSSSSAKERRVYARWSNDEEKMLLSSWAENFDCFESREARKAWDDIAKKMNDKCGGKRTTDKYQKKMKYLVDRCEQAKDWNSKQSGGNRRKSAHYDEIDEVLGCRDIVTLQNVQEAGNVSEESDTNKTSTGASVECDDDAGTRSKKDARLGKEENEEEGKGGRKGR